MTTLQRFTRLAMIAVPVVFMAAFTALQMTFDYPGILRQSASEILAGFSAGGAGLLALWYVFMLSALAFIPAEPFGFALAGIINAAAYTLWAGWLVVLGIIILRE